MDVLGQRMEEGRLARISLPDTEDTKRPPPGAPSGGLHVITNELYSNRDEYA